MARSPAIFKKADVKRAVAGARAAGMTVGRVEVEAGKIIVFAASDAKPQINELDRELEDWATRNDQG